MIARAGDEFDPTRLDADVRRVKRIEGIADVAYKTKTVKRGVEITFEIVEGTPPAAPKPDAGSESAAAPEPPQPTEAPTAEPTDAPTPDEGPEAPAEPAPRPPAPQPPAPSAKQPPAPVGVGAPGVAKVGVVDMSRILDEWQAAQAMQEERRRVSQLPDLRQRELQYRLQLIALTEAEAERAVELSQKGRLTDKLNKELTDLEEKARARDSEFLALLSKAERTPEEQERFALLKETRDNRERQLGELQQKYTDEIRQAAADLDEQNLQAADTVRMAVAEVAQKMGLELVFDYAKVLYGGLDITSEVVERLNKEPSLVSSP
jgi:Skp family chaperone for outer membrane proteins